jgi:hypothetical protein
MSDPIAEVRDALLSEGLSLSKVDLPGSEDRELPDVAVDLGDDSLFIRVVEPTRDDLYLDVETKLWDTSDYATIREEIPAVAILSEDLPYVVLPLDGFAKLVARAQA